MKKLTAKQERFVAEYLIDLNATQAAIRAGYSKKTAGQIGEQNLKKLEIAAAVAEGCAKQEQRAPGRRDITTAPVRFQHPIREALKPDLDLGPAEPPDPPNFFGRNVIRPRLDDEADAATGSGLIDEMRRFEFHPIHALARIKQRGSMRLA